VVLVYTMPAASSSVSTSAAVNGNLNAKTKTKAREKKDKISSQQVFTNFLKVNEDGSLNAEDILSKKCFETWLASRRTETQNPAESFRRAVTATCRGSDGRKPFPEVVEEALLKELRKKKAWACFADTNVQIGKKGFPSMGYHEKLKSKTKLNKILKEKSQTGTMKILEKQKRPNPKATNSIIPKLNVNVASEGTPAPRVVEVTASNSFSLSHVKLKEDSYQVPFQEVPAQEHEKKDEDISGNSEEENDLIELLKADITPYDGHEPTQREQVLADAVVPYLVENREGKTGRRRSRQSIEEDLDTFLKREKYTVVKQDLDAEEIVNIVYDDSFPDEVKRAARSFLDYYSVDGLRKLILTGRDHGVEYFTTPLMYMIDMHPKNGDPRFQKEFICPNMHIKFDHNRPVGSMIVSPELLVIDTNQNLRHILRGNSLNINASTLQVSRLQSLLIMQHGLPRMMRYGENWHFARLYRHDGTIGVFLVHCIAQGISGNMRLDIQDVSTHMQHILRLPLELC